MFQQINDPKSVIANVAFAKRLVRAASPKEKRSEMKQSQDIGIATLHFVALAMTIGHFFTWSTLTNVIDA